MELKSKKCVYVFKAAKGSNRTFMELKFHYRFDNETVGFVLIVPLWNWNMINNDANTAVISSNRTFMELKLLCNIYILQ